MKAIIIGNDEFETTCKFELFMEEDTFVLGSKGNIEAYGLQEIENAIENLNKTVAKYRV